MYSINGAYRERIRRKIIAISFTLILLAEFGEFFVPKNDHSTHEIRIEISDHITSDGKNNPAPTKPKPSVRVPSKRT